MKKYLFGVLCTIMSASTLQAAQLEPQSESPQHQDRTTIVSQSKSPRLQRSVPSEQGRQRSKSLTNPAVTTPAVRVLPPQVNAVAALFAKFELNGRR